MYAALVPVAYFISLNAPGRKDWQLWTFTAAMHALLSAVVAACTKAVVSILESWIPKSRWRAYTGQMRNFLGVLAIWPSCIAIIMVVWKLRHG